MTWGKSLNEAVLSSFVQSIANNACPKNVYGDRDRKEQKESSLNLKRTMQIRYSAETEVPQRQDFFVGLFTAKSFTSRPVPNTLAPNKH